jgi:RES domain-containing protein
MAGPGRRHDRDVLDRLEAMAPEAFAGEVWRVTARGRDPLLGSAAGGRWSPVGEFDVIYTSLEREGALAEIGFRMSLEPVWPSKLQHDLYRLAARTRRTIRFPDVVSLVPFGVDAARYQGFDYGATQAIAAAARFLGFDSLIVPSARSPARHLVVFIDDAMADETLTLLATEPVDWDAWRRQRR